ncbi:MAG: cytochrome P450 [Cyanobacteria bacterium J06638_6]
MGLTEKVLKAHDHQVKLSHQLAKVGYESTLGRLLRLKAYYRDAFIMVKAWRDFLYIRRDHIGETYFAVDQALMHTSHQRVKALMQVEPQVRGNDLGIIRILAPSYLLNNPLSLGMNGEAHDGARAVFWAALPDAGANAADLGDRIHQQLAIAASRGQLHVGDDLPRMMAWLLHQIVFDLTLTETELKASRAYIKGLSLASMPNFISRYLLAFKTAPNIRHRKQLINQYQRSPRWAEYQQVGNQYQLNDHQIANTLFDMIHIAGTEGTSALLGSVIGVLCQQDELRAEVMAECDRVWDGKTPLTGAVLEQTSLLKTVILETARLYPPVRFVSQLSPSAGEVTVGKQTCPFQKGTRLLGSIFTANRDSERYADPDRFDVTRDYSDLLSWNDHDHERTCPGRDLSIGLIQIFCLYLFHCYQWKSTTEIAWDFHQVTAVTPNDLVLQGFAQRD